MSANQLEPTDPPLELTSKDRLVGGHGQNTNKLLNTQVEGVLQRCGSIYSLVKYRRVSLTGG